MWKLLGDGRAPAGIRHVDCPSYPSRYVVFVRPSGSRPPTTRSPVGVAAKPNAARGEGILSGGAWRGTFSQLDSAMLNFQRSLNQVKLLPGPRAASSSSSSYSSSLNGSSASSGYAVRIFATSNLLKVQIHQRATVHPRRKLGQPCLGHRDRGHPLFANYFAHC